MSSSISSSDPAPPPRRGWRRFFLTALATALIGCGSIYLFIVMVDPFDQLPFSVPMRRWPIDSNARYSFPALARSDGFDSAVFGTSSSRLLRPEQLDQVFGGRFVNLSMNAATAYEQSRLLDVFLRHHEAPRTIVIGLDIAWCALGDTLTKYTDRPMPEWMYEPHYWRGYREMLNLDALEKAGQAFAEFTGLKKQVYGSDGYTRFVPDDSEYDPVRVAMHLREDHEALERDGKLAGNPASWSFAALDLLPTVLHRIPRETRVILLFVPYNHTMLGWPAMSDGPDPECKRRATAIVAKAPNATLVDFMLPSPITNDDSNYWDGLHYRVGIATRIVLDLGTAARGEASADYRILKAPEGKAPGEPTASTRDERGRAAAAD